MGAASIALARSFPNLTLVVQDLRENVNNRKAAAAQLPAELASCITFQEHDFFQAQPERGAEVYLLRTVLHDWQDDDAVAILRNLAGAMSSGPRLVIMHMVLPPPGSMASSQERLLCARDMTMLDTFNSLKGDEEDRKRLLATADRGLTLRCIRKPTGGSVLSLLDIVYKTVLAFSKLVLTRKQLTLCSSIESTLNTMNSLKQFGKERYA